MTQTVVITGASAGIARATARLYGARGDRVGLIARGQAGLDGAAADVEEAGGTAFAVTADVADFDQVDKAASRIEDALGPIDVWINVAFTIGIRAVRRAERRGVPPGHRGELPGLRPWHDGRAPADDPPRPRHHRAGRLGPGARSIPLQSAYCGAKHAINGFTSSLRCELLHEGSNVKVTVVQMPAVNTPQFSWVRSRLPDKPQPVPPIYQPEVAARGVVYAADHPARREYWVGASTAATLAANKLAPALLDRYLARTGYKAQQTDQADDPGRPDNLLEPVDGPAGVDHGAHGSFDDRAHGRSAQLWISQHAGTSALVAGGAVAASALFALAAKRHESTAT